MAVEKKVIKYHQVLHRAHQEGLVSLKTRPIQFPNNDNGMVAIFEATAILEKEGKFREFTTYGDAAPNNVAPAMRSCLIRMADTRAKCRALKDAVDIGTISAEDLTDFSDVEEEAGSVQEEKKQEAVCSECQWRNGSHKATCSKHPKNQQQQAQPQSKPEPGMSLKEARDKATERCIGMGLDTQAEHALMFKTLLGYSPTRRWTVEDFIEILNKPAHDWRDASDTVFAQMQQPVNEEDREVVT